MLNIILVGSGGFIGSALRYLIGLGVHSLLRSATFPYGTLAANLIGCLLIGLFYGLADERLLFSPQTRLFLLAGILGGFTTFSAFSLDTFTMMRDHDMPALILAALHVFSHVAFGLAAVYVGNWLARVV